MYDTFPNATHFTLKTEAARASETSVFFRHTTRRRNIAVSQHNETRWELANYFKA